MSNALEQLEKAMVLLQEAIELREREDAAASPAPTGVPNAKPVEYAGKEKERKEGEERLRRTTKRVRSRPGATGRERQQLLFGIFTVALEGGINHWCSINEYHWRRPDDTDDIDGFYADIRVEDEPGAAHRIDAAVIERGLKALAGMRTQHHCTLAQQLLAYEGDWLDAPDYDADFADNVVQAGLFNDIVYG